LRHNRHDASIVIASVQTLSRRTRLTRLVSDFQTIVIDEAHHAPAPTYRRILEYCHAWCPDGPLVVGVTATPERGDRQSLRQVFDRIVYQKTLVEMMQAGYLVDLRALQVLLQADFDALRTQHGDFVEAELETLLLAANAPAQILAAFQTHTADRKALVFPPTVALAYAMADTFRMAGIPAEALDGTTPLATRRAILQRLHTGATRVVAPAPSHREADGAAPQAGGGDPPGADQRRGRGSPGGSPGGLGVKGRESQGKITDVIATTNHRVNNHGRTT